MSPTNNLRQYKKVKAEQDLWIRVLKFEATRCNGEIDIPRVNVERVLIWIADACGPSCIRWMTIGPKKEGIIRVERVEPCKLYPAV